METGMAGTPWLSEQVWDHIFYNPPHADWYGNTNTRSAAEEQMDVDLDAAECPSWGDLIINKSNGCTVNNDQTLPADLQAIREYLLDEEVQDYDSNIQEDPSPGRDASDPVKNSGPKAGDQLLSDTGLVTNSSSESKSNETEKLGSGSGSGSASSSVEVDDGALKDSEYKGLRLLHLLTACAEAKSLGAQDLVEVTLCRLRGLVSPTGFTMERVAYYLFDALLHSNVNSLPHLELNDKISKDHFLGALKLLHVAYPYIRFPHFTANQCILEAVAGAAGGAANNVGIHIVDFDVMDGMQWPPLMEALRNSGKNYDVGHLRITAIKWTEDEDDGCLLYSGHTGRRLSAYASSVGIPFSFQEIDLKALKEVVPQETEIVIVNCIWQLPHMLNLRNKSQLLEFLVGSRRLNPKAVTLATGPHGAESGAADFLDNFTRRLWELCTIFDSLEAGLPEHGLARAMVERIFFGPAMSRRVTSGTACGDHSAADTTKSNVVDLPIKCRYGEGSISSSTIMYAKGTLLCSGGNASYEVELVGRHRLVLKWASTPVLWISTWKSVNP